MESFSDIRPNKKEILRYLGYRNQPLDTEFLSLLKECTDTVEAFFQPRFVYNTFPLEFQPAGIAVTGTTLILTGESIRRHLSGCRRCILLAATIGMDIEKEITRCTKTNVTKATILDAAATSLIEEFCDGIETTIQKQEDVDSCEMTARFSPGYGDLPIALQPVLLSVLSAQKKIGLTCSENNILMPRKSVTAIIGISDTTVYHTEKGCETCNAQGCKFKRTGAST